MEKVRFGVAGVGGMGEGHCNYLRDRVPEASLGAVYDVNAERAQAVGDKFGVPGYHNLEAFLNSGSFEAVLIATPHYFHADIAVQSFQRGLHALSEKPISVTVSQADGMIEAARQSGKLFGIMYQMRAEPVYQAARKLVQEGVIGEVYRTLLITGWYRTQAYYDSGGWRATWAGEGGGVLINQAPHYLDLFAWLGGLPSQIQAQTRTRLHDIEVEDEAFALLEYANGAHGYLYASTTEVPSENVIEVCGDRGKLKITDGHLEVWQTETSVRDFTQTSPEMWAGVKTRPLETHISPRPEGALKDHAAITQNFARAILHGEPLIAPGEEGLWAIELINGVILSGKQGNPVSVPVDRAAYDQLMTELKASSKPKTRIQAQTQTDPNFR